MVRRVAKLGLLVLTLFLATPLGFAQVTTYPADEGTPKETTVGGQHGVVVEHGGGEGTGVMVGGHRGVVVQHNSDGSGTGVQIGGPRGLTIGHHD